MIQNACRSDCDCRSSDTVGRHARNAPESPEEKRTGGSDYSHWWGSILSAQGPHAQATLKSTTRGR